MATKKFIKKYNASLAASGGNLSENGDDLPDRTVVAGAIQQLPQDLQNLHIQQQQQQQQQQPSIQALNLTTGSSARSNELSVITSVATSAHNSAIRPEILAKYPELISINGETEQKLKKSKSEEELRRKNEEYYTLLRGFLNKHLYGPMVNVYQSYDTQKLDQEAFPQQPK